MGFPIPIREEWSHTFSVRGQQNPTGPGRVLVTRVVTHSSESESEEGRKAGRIITQESALWHEDPRASLEPSQSHPATHSHLDTTTQAVAQITSRSPIAITLHTFFSPEHFRIIIGFVDFC